MSNKIKIQEILNKHRVKFQGGDKPFRGIAGDEALLKAAIKEIVEAVVDKCTEEENKAKGRDKYQHWCTEKSILQVKNMINYD